MAGSDSSTHPTAPTTTFGYGPSSKHYIGEKLIGNENFALWKLQFLSFLRRNDLERFIADTSTDADQATREAYAIYDELLCSITASLASQFVTHRTAKDLWKVVVSRFENQSRTRINTLRSSLWNLKLYKDGDLRLILEKFNKVVSEVRQAAGEVGISDADAVQILVQNIKTGKYESEIRVIMDKTDLSLTDVCDRLLAYEANMAVRFGGGFEAPKRARR